MAYTVTLTYSTSGGVWGEERRGRERGDIGQDDGKVVRRGNRGRVRVNVGRGEGELG